MPSHRSQPEIPLDVWIEIARHLSIPDLLTLRSISKLFELAVESRDIWEDVLRDIARVTQSYHLLHDLASMSTKEVKRKALSVLRLQYRLGRENIVPSNVERLLVKPAPSRHSSVFLPGGSCRRFVAHIDQNLVLYEIGVVSTDVLATIRLGHTHHVQLFCSSDPYGDPVLICGFDSQVVGSKSDIAVFRVILDKPAFVLLSQSSEPHFLQYATATEDIWAYGYSGINDEQYMIIRTLNNSRIQSIPQQVTVHLCPEILPPTPVKLLSRTRLLWSSITGVSIYDIPELYAIKDLQSSIVHNLQPTWSRCRTKEGPYNLLSPSASSIVWASHGGSRIGSCSVLADDDILLLNVSEEDCRPQCLSFSIDRELSSSGVSFISLLHAAYVSDLHPHIENSVLVVAALPHGYAQGGFRLGFLNRLEARNIEGQDGILGVSLDNSDLELGYIQLPWVKEEACIHDLHLAAGTGQLQLLLAAGTYPDPVDPFADLFITMDLL